MSTEQAVAAVIVSWNNYDDTAECLQSIGELRYPNLDVILVDNGSTDDSAERLDREFQDVDVMYTGENLGPPGAMNIGTREALERGADYIWLLNNDTLFPDTDVVGTLVDRFDQNPDLGMLSPLIREYPSTDGIWFLRGDIDWRFGNADHDDRSTRDENGLVDNDYIPFCAVMIPADVIEIVGLLPERYFIYYDDVDYSVQIKQRGYRLATDTSTEIYHKEMKGTERLLNPLVSYYESRNLLLFARRFSDLVGPLYLAHYFAWLMKHLGIRAVFRDGEGLQALLKGTLDGVRNRTGKGRYP